MKNFINTEMSQKLKFPNKLDAIKFQDKKNWSQQIKCCNNTKVANTETSQEPNGYKI